MRITATPKPSKLYRTFRYQLDLTDAQIVALCFWLAACAYVYNWALTRRREQYEAWKGDNSVKKSLTRFDQHEELKAFRVLSVALLNVPVVVLRSAIDRLDEAFQGFFRRVAEGDDPGYPRYRKGDRYDSFCFPWQASEIVGSGRSARLWIPLFGYVKLNMYRPLKGTPKTVAIHRESTGKWYVCICCDLGEAPAKLDPSTIRDDRKVGMDLGVTSLVATSDGELVDNPRHFEKSQDQLAARQRRVMKVTQPGSNGRKRARRLVAKTHKRIANQRRDFMFKLAKRLVKENDLIAFEQLNIAGLAQGKLGKHVNNAAWRILVQAIMCKAEEAGTWAVGVDPRYTSQECSRCGRLVPKNLHVRVHRCPHCELVLDRDVNAARVILARGVTALGTSVEQATEARCSAKARRSKKSTATTVERN